MEGMAEQKKIRISFKHVFLLVISQTGGAAIIYLPGVVEAGRDVWISNMIASIMAYVVIYTHYLPLSLCPEQSMTKILCQYWGKLVGGFVNLYYLTFCFVLSCLVVSDIYFFGEITMPDTPSYVFIIFFLVPAVYGIKLGIEVIARMLEFLMPLIVVIYSSLFLLVIPKIDFTNLTPIMAEGIQPVWQGTIPNMGFPYAQVLPIVFYYKYIRENVKGSDKKFLKYAFAAVLLSSMLLTLRSVGAIAAFDEATLKTLTFPPFNAIRLIEVGNVLERIDALFLATFYITTFLKFVITCYVICQIISEYFGVGEPRDFSIPIAVLIGVTMPFLIPRLDIVFEVLVPYFILSLPLFIPIPLLLFATIKMKKSKKSKGGAE